MITDEACAPPLQWDPLGNSYLSTDTRFFVVPKAGATWSAYRRQLPQAVLIGDNYPDADNAKAACQAAA